MLALILCENESLHLNTRLQRYDGVHVDYTMMILIVNFFLFVINIVK